VKLGKIRYRQAMFAIEYLKDLNASAAARRAGYAEKWADKLGRQLLRKPHVVAVVQAEIEARLDVHRATADRIIAEVARVGFANLGDYMTVLEDGSAVVDLSGATPQQLAALSEITVDEYTEGRGDGARNVKRVRIKLADKLAALNTLAKYRGLLVDRQELSGVNGGPVEVATIRRVIVDPKAPPGEG
jgi:phage terminase small subunit